MMAFISPFIRLPVLLGFTFCAVMLTGILTVTESNRTTRSTVDNLGISVCLEMDSVIRSQVIAYFVGVETMLHGASMAVLTDLVDPTNASSMRPLLAYLARYKDVDNMKVYYAEVHQVDYEYWNQTGQYRGITYGFYGTSSWTGLSASGPEWYGYQPGLLHTYFVNFTFPELPRTGEGEMQESVDLEPVVFQARSATDIEFQHTFVYNTSVEVPAVYLGVFIPFRKNNRLDFYINVQFSIAASDQFVMLLSSLYPFHAALLEYETGEFMADTNSDQGVFVVEENGVRRLTYRESTDPMIREGGEYVYRNLPSIGDDARHVSRATIAGVECYVSFSVIQVRSITWIMYVVIPSEPIRGEIDRTAWRSVVAIIVLYIMDGTIALMVLVWVSWALRELSQEMGIVSTMELDNIRPPRNLIVYEMLKIQREFYIMIQHLKQYSEYLPKHVLVGKGEEDGENADEDPSEPSVPSREPSSMFPRNEKSIDESLDSYPLPSLTPPQKQHSTNALTRQASVLSSRQTSRKRGITTLHKMMERKTVTVLVLNLRASHLSMETHPRDDFTEMLFRSMTIATEVVAKRKGTTLNVFGDHHVVGFGVVTKCSHQGPASCGTAIEVNRRISKEGDSDYEKKIIFSSGAASGTALCGDVIASGTRTLTALGTVTSDAVQIQEMCKSYGASTLHVVSKEVYHQSSIDYAFKVLDVKWRGGNKDDIALIAELLGPLIGDEVEQEEWMYTLNNDDGALQYYNKYLSSIGTGKIAVGSFEFLRGLEEFNRKYGSNPHVQDLRSDLQRITQKLLQATRVKANDQHRDREVGEDQVQEISC
eukprot:PhF_6_TR26636/c0_g1_i5/m.38577